MTNSSLTYLICCPKCQKDLTAENSKLICLKCKKEYIIKDDIPVLLIQ